MTPGQTTDANPGAVAMPSGESGRTALFPSSTPGLLWHTRRLFREPIPKTQLLYIPASAPERECDMIA